MKKNENYSTDNYYLYCEILNEIENAYKFFVSFESMLNKKSKNKINHVATFSNYETAIKIAESCNCQ